MSLTTAGKWGAAPCRVSVYVQTCLLALVAGGCSLDSQPQSSGLIVVVDSEFPVPKDIDHLRFQVTQSDRVLRSEEHALGDGNLQLPAEFRVAATGDENLALLQVVAFKGSTPRVERSALVSIPLRQTRLLRLALNFLCESAVGPDGESTCGSQRTCRQGSCEPQQIALSDLPTYDSSTSAATGTTSDAASEACFDVVNCFAVADPISPDLASCSFPAPALSSAEQSNLAFVLPPHRDGVCDAQHCWIVIDAGHDLREGWTFDGANILLPPAICHVRSELTLAYSSRCPSKRSETPICASSAVPEDTPAPASNLPRPPVGEACEGVSAQSCGDCGMQTRQCQGGRWSDWSDCSAQGVCSLASAQACGSGGTQTCSAECQWSACEGQLCEGAALRSCGNCGAQRRSCTNGVWSDWSACSEQGECTPGAAQSCGLGGTQSCAGNCGWAACENQACAGSALQVCGNCGTRTRRCDPRTADWSDWSPCSGEGECPPDAARSCGASGTQICAGNCAWDAACSGQVCSGSPTRTCGNCGIQARLCDSTSGRWSGWSQCTGQGVCEPTDTRSCGAGGTQTCNTSCRWNSACTGQVCRGEGVRSCGNCGEQTRTCDGTTGRWSSWSNCSSEGACSPGNTRSCGAGGTQRCGDDCSWQSACNGQVCSGAASQNCGNCGTQSRSCDASSGRWSDWSACGGQGACAPGSSQRCGGNGDQLCGNDCQWQACVHTCPPASTRSCGNCGTQTSSCDPASGIVTWSDCRGEKSCAPAATQLCANGRAQTCNADCEWGNCGCDPAETRPCGNCGSQTSSCDPATGKISWGGCSGEGECKPSSSQSCSAGGAQTCSDSCHWSSCCPPSTTRACGHCGTQISRCDPATGEISWSDCSDEGECTPDANRSCADHATQVCDAQCGWGECRCELGFDRCGEDCVDLQTDDAHCGACDQPCPAGTPCSTGTCTQPDAGASAP